MLFIAKLGMAVPWLLLAVTVAAAPAHPLDTRGVVNTAPLVRSQLAHDVVVASEPLVARNFAEDDVERRNHELVHPETRGTKETNAPDGPATQDPSVAQPGGHRRRDTQDEPIAREFKSIHEPGDGGADGLHGREFKSVHEPGDGGADGLHGRRTFVAREFKSVHEPGDGGADGLHGREFKSVHEPGDGGADGLHGRREFKSIHEPGDGGADGLHGRGLRREFKSIHEPGDGELMGYTAVAFVGSSSRSTSPETGELMGYTAVAFVGSSSRSTSPETVGLMGSMGVVLMLVLTSKPAATVNQRTRYRRACIVL